MFIKYRLFLEVASIVLNLFNILPVLLGSYIFIISIFAWRKRKETGTYKGPTSSYALIIAAHNEETVIHNIIENLKKLEYPVDKYDIFVIADNCTDKTAEIARKSGALVYERFNKSEEGKGHALKWMFNILFNLEKKYDAVCIFDADNLVSVNFLKEIDKKLCAGYKVVQGYRDVKNPFDSWITASYAITYWISNRLFQLPRHYLGMNNTITGSGYAVRTDTLRETGWEISSLTEDIEFSVQLMLKDIKIGWAHDAVIYDEQPLTLSQSWSQRKRWMQGHAYCAARYTRELGSKLLCDRSLAAFDSMIVMLYPFILVFGCLFTFLGTASYFALHYNKLSANIIAFLLPSLILYILQSAYFGVFIKLEKRFRLEVLMGLIVFPIFNLTWIPIIIQGFIDRNKKEWIHIAHIRNININEL